MDRFYNVDTNRNGILDLDDILSIYNNLSDNTIDNYEETIQLYIDNRAQYLSSNYDYELLEITCTNSSAEQCEEHIINDNSYCSLNNNNGICSVNHSILNNIIQLNDLCVDPNWIYDTERDICNTSLTRTDTYIGTKLKIEDENGDFTYYNIPSIIEIEPNGNNDYNLKFTDTELVETNRDKLSVVCDVDQGYMENNNLSINYNFADNEFSIEGECEKKKMFRTCF